MSLSLLLTFFPPITVNEIFRKLQIPPMTPKDIRTCQHGPHGVGKGFMEYVQLLHHQQTRRPLGDGDT